jgi:hypothetical protein
LKFSEYPTAGTDFDEDSIIGGNNGKRYRVGQILVYSRTVGHAKLKRLPKWQCSCQRRISVFTKTENNPMKFGAYCETRRGFG